MAKQPEPAGIWINGKNLLTSKWVEEVKNTAENDLRAHRIALTYFHFAAHLDDLIHGPHSVRNARHLDPKDRARVVHNANWFNFAMWGTLTVSQNIGNQQPLQRLNSGPGMLLRRALTPAVLNVKASGGQEVARALARGQLTIFISACHAFMHFLRLGPDDDTVEPDDVLPDIGPRYAGPVASACSYFAKARSAVDPVTKAVDSVARAQLMLGANLRLTQVEQDFADSAVSTVVDLVPRRIAGALDWRIAKLADWFRGVPTHLSYILLNNLHTDERSALDTIWSRFMTDQVLVMALPTETLRVGRDIPPLQRDRPYYPNDLLFPHDHRRITGCYKHDRIEIAELVRSIDRTVGAGRGSAARDWRRWDERLNWALTLLRSRQHDETLFWRPYSTRDAERIVAGELPERTGDPSALDIQPPLEDQMFNTLVNAPFLPKDDREGGAKGLLPDAEGPDHDR